MNRLSKCNGRKAALISGLFFTAQLFIGSLAYSREAIRFYDWQADVLLEEKGKKRCYIEFAGATQGGIFLTMHLSLIEEVISQDNKRRMTFMKIAAKKIDSAAFSEQSPIEIEEAWLETPQRSSIGKIEKTDAGQSDAFIGGLEGFEWFEGLLNDIGKAGVTIGYRSAADSGETIVQAPAPPQGLFLKLLSC